MNLTDEDKQWIVGQIERVESRVEAKLEATEKRMDVKLEAMETRLLTAFHQWASPVDTRLRSHTAVLRALDEDLEALKDKVKGLESR